MKDYEVLVRKKGFDVTYCMWALLERLQIFFRISSKILTSKVKIII